MQTRTVSVTEGYLTGNNSQRARDQNFRNFQPGLSVNLQVSEFARAGRPDTLKRVHEAPAPVALDARAGHRPSWHEVRGGRAGRFLSGIEWNIPFLLGYFVTAIRPSSSDTKGGFTTPFQGVLPMKVPV